jgi:hypothetical protein
MDNDDFKVDDRWVALLLVIPLIWVPWLWVFLSFLPLSPVVSILTILKSAMLTTRFADDRFETCHRRPFHPDLLQLPSHGLFRECSRFPGEMGCRAL